MNCFIHLNKESTNYCSVCKRPICNECANVQNGICPRCSNFTHSTVFNYNKRLLKFFIPFLLIRFTVYYDVLVLTLYSDKKMDYTSTGFIILMLCFLPFIINIIKYTFKNALRYQIFGKRDAIEIADDLKWKSLLTIITGIVTLIICCILCFFVTPLFLITDIIHLIKCIKDLIYHKKRIISETQIRGL